MLQAIGLTSTPRRDLPPAVDDLTFEARAGPCHRPARRARLRQDHRAAADARTRAGPGRHLLPRPPAAPHRRTRPARSACSSATYPAIRRAPPAASCGCSAPPPECPPPAPTSVLDVVGLAGLADQRLGTLSLGMDRRLGARLRAARRPAHADPRRARAGALAPREQLAVRTAARPRRPRRHGAAHHRATPRRPPASPTASSPSTRAASSPTRTPPTSPVPGCAPASPSAPRTPPGWPPSSAGRRAPPSARSRWSPRAAAALRVRQQLRRDRRDGLPARRPRPPARRRGRRHRPASGPRRPVRDRPGAATGVRARSPARPAEPQSSRPMPGGRRIRAATAPAVRPRAGSAARRRRRAPCAAPCGPCATNCAASSGPPPPVLIAAAVARRLRSPCPCCSPAPAAPRCPRCSPPGPSCCRCRPPPSAPDCSARSAFGEEFRYPALAAARGTVPRRLGLLLAKLAVTARGSPCCSALLVVVADVQALRLVFGSDSTPRPARTGLPWRRVGPASPSAAPGPDCSPPASSGSPPPGWPRYSPYRS